LLNLWYFETARLYCLKVIIFICPSSQKGGQAGREFFMTLEEAVKELLDRWHSPYQTERWINDLETALREVEKAYYARRKIE